MIEKDTLGHTKFDSINKKSIKSQTRNFLLICWRFNCITCLTIVSIVNVVIDPSNAFYICIINKLGPNLMR